MRIKPLMSLIQSVTLEEESVNYTLLQAPPKEQPPRNLSGKRTLRLGASGKWARRILAPPKVKATLSKLIGGESLRFSTEGVIAFVRTKRRLVIFREGL